MLGRILCWIGWHKWGYSVGDVILRADSRAIALDRGGFYGFTYRCLRCGVKP